MAMATQTAAATPTRGPCVVATGRGRGGGDPTRGDGDLLCSQGDQGWRPARPKRRRLARPRGPAVARPERRLSEFVRCKGEGGTTVAAAEEDLVCPRTLLQNAVWTSLYKCVEPVLSSWPINKLRERALGNLMEHIHYEDENTQYLCICATNKALNMVCCWIEDPNSDAFKRHLARIPDSFWLSEDGMKAQVYDGCQSWETAFIIQAFCATDLVNEYGPTLERAHAFIKNSQVMRNHRGDKKLLASPQTEGFMDTFKCRQWMGCI